MLERKWLLFFGTIRERREKNQYDLATTATPEEIRALLTLSAEFVGELGQLPKPGGDNPGIR